jgi:hypothetical protein
VVKVNRDFEDGLEFGCAAGFVFYLGVFTVAFLVYGKTHSFPYFLGILSLGLLAMMFLSKIAKLLSRGISGQQNDVNKDTNRKAKHDKIFRKC